MTIVEFTAACASSPALHALAEIVKIVEKAQRDGVLIRYSMEWPAGTFEALMTYYGNYAREIDEDGRFFIEIDGVSFRANDYIEGL